MHKASMDAVRTYTKAGNPQYKYLNVKRTVTPVSRPVQLLILEGLVISAHMLSRARKLANAFCPQI